jgi:hypothetical protein
MFQVECCAKLEIRNSNSCRPVSKFVAAEVTRQYASKIQKYPPFHEPTNKDAAPTELGRGSRGVDSYKDGAPTELFKLVHGPLCALKNVPAANERRPKRHRLPHSMTLTRQIARVFFREVVECGSPDMPLSLRRPAKSVSPAFVGLTAAILRLEISSE